MSVSIRLSLVATKIVAYEASLARLLNSLLKVARIRNVMADVQLLKLLSPLFEKNEQMVCFGMQVDRENFQFQKFCDTVELFDAQRRGTIPKSSSIIVNVQCLKVNDFCR